MVKSLLSEADARDVEAAVTRAEQQTSAEIVVAVLPRSDDYFKPRALLAAAWALAAGFAYLHFAPWHEPALALVLELAVAACVIVIAGSAGLLRWLVPARAVDAAVNARAYQLFAERGLHGTRGRTALLVFVSELEHRVVLLGDRTIHERLGQQGWDQHIELLISHIKRGELRQGLVAVLDRLTPELAAVAPREADDVNELPDSVLRR